MSGRSRRDEQVRGVGLDLVHVPFIFSPSSISDHAFIEEQESHLLTICQRTMALPVGRWAYTF